MHRHPSDTPRPSPRFGASPPVRGSRRARSGLLAGARLAPVLLAPLLFGSAARPCAAAPVPAAVAPRATVLERRAESLGASLRTKRLGRVRFEDADLDAVLSVLRVSTGWNFVLRRHVLLAAGIDPASIRSRLELDDVPVGVILLAVLEPHGLAAVVEGNVIHVTTKADALGPPVFRLYDIRHLTWRRTDFHGPELDLLPSGYVDPEGRDRFGGETPVEDDPFTDPQHVVDLVREMVDGTWDAPGWTIRATPTFLAVKAPRNVQRGVLAAIARMAELR